MNITEVTRVASDENTVRFLIDGNESFASIDHPAIKAWEAGGGVIGNAPQLDQHAPPLTARQLRLGLVMNGISLDQVTAEIDAIPGENDRTLAKIEWEYASQFEREHYLINQVGTALDLTAEQIDAMWMEASGL
jgi:hypothetical protein